MKGIILCADDYGQNLTISQAIIELLSLKKLSATSCLVTSPLWLNHALWLEPFKNQVDIGLHLNLTEGQSLTSAFSFLPLPNLLKKAYFRQLSKKSISLEFKAQIEQFRAGMGCLPDYIDGHQHIHQFPIIRDVVIDIYQQYLKPRGYLRSIDNKTIFKRNACFKRIILQLCGARRFTQMLQQNHIPHNTSFSGVYHFSDSERYPELFIQFLQQTQNKGIIMCHPGLKANDSIDSNHEARYNEYCFFRSSAFSDICSQNDIKLVRFS